MSKRKIWSDFNRLECGKTEKIFAGTWSFNKRVEISSSVERMVLQGGSKLEENETNDADTFIIHYTAVCLHFRLDRLLYAILILAEVYYTASFCLYTIKYKSSVCSQKPALFCYRHLDSTSVSKCHQHNRHQKCRVPVCRNIQIEKENVKQQIAKRSL